jgi:hypothetical protein
MKKIFAIISLTSSMVVYSNAQGVVNFSDTGGTKISTNSVVGGPATSTTDASSATQPEFYYALFYSTTLQNVGSSSNAVVGTSGTYAFNAAGWTFSGAYGTNSTTGRMLSSTLDAAGNTVVSGLAGGTSAYFTVIGWSANIGNSVAAVQSYLSNPGFNGFVGEAAVSGLLAPGTEGSTPATGLYGGAYPNITGFTLGLVTPVPEPGTMALAALSGASLLLFRRRK